MTIKDLTENKKVLNLKALIVETNDDGLIIADESGMAFLSVPVESQYKIGAVVSILKAKVVEKTSHCLILKPHPSFSPTILKNSVIKIADSKMDEMMATFSYAAPKSKLLNSLSNEEEVDLEVYITGCAKVEKMGQKPYNLYFIADKSGSIGRIMDYLKTPIPVGCAGFWRDLVTVERKEDYSVLMKTSRRSTFSPDPAIWESFKGVKIGKFQDKNVTLVGYSNVRDNRADLLFVDSQHDDLTISFDIKKLGLSSNLEDHLENSLAQVFTVDYDKSSNGQVNFGVRMLP